MYLRPGDRGEPAPGGRRFEIGGRAQPDNLALQVRCGVGRCEPWGYPWSGGVLGGPNNAPRVSAHPEWPGEVHRHKPDLTGLFQMGRPGLRPGLSRFSVVNGRYSERAAAAGCRLSVPASMGAFMGVARFGATGVGVRWHVSEDRLSDALRWPRVNSRTHMPCLQTARVRTPPRS